MTCIVFPHVRWSDFSLPDLLARISEREPVYYIEANEKELPPWLSAHAAEQLRELEGTVALALVFHPYWIDAAMSNQP